MTYNFICRKCNREFVTDMSFAEYRKPRCCDGEMETHFSKNRTIIYTPTNLQAVRRHQ